MNVARAAEIDPSPDRASLNAGIVPASMLALMLAQGWRNASIDASVPCAGRPETVPKDAAGLIVWLEEKGSSQARRGPKAQPEKGEPEMPQTPKPDPARAARARQVARQLRWRYHLADVLHDSGVEVTLPRFLELVQLVAGMLPPQNAPAASSRPEGRIAA